MLFDASKYISQIAILSVSHLQMLIESATVRNISKVVLKEDFRTEFLSSYRAYLEKGVLDRANLSVGLSLDPSVWSVQEVGSSRKLIRPTQPVVIVKPYSFMVTNENKVLGGVLGKSGSAFGLEFSYPAMYRDSKTGLIKNGLKESKNASLFKSITRWMRSSTSLLQIKIGDEMINTQMRVDEESEVKLESIKGVVLCVKSS